MRNLFRLLTIALALGTLAPVLAGEPGRYIFLRYEGTGKELEQFHAAVHRFQSEVFRAEREVEFVNRDDASKVYTECRGLRVEADPMQERMCWFTVVERLGVQNFLEITLVDSNAGVYEFKMDIWNPSTRGLIYTSFVTQEAADLRGAFQAGLPALARDYLCFRGDDRFCAASGEGGGDAGAIADGDASDINWLGWGLTAGGVLLLLAIIPFGIANRSNEDDIKFLPEDHPDRQSFEDARQDNAIAMGVLGALGTVSLAVGLGFLIWDWTRPGPEGEESVLQLQPTLGPGDVGLGLQLRF